MRFCTYNIFFFVFIFFLNSIYSQVIDQKLNNQIEQNVSNNKIVSININNTKYTSKKYILNLLNLKEGDIWDNSRKEEIRKNFELLSRQISRYEISENQKEDGIELIITVEEKLPFLIIPFFTYSNSSGLKPKILFRHYNLFGYGKYLGIKWEFLPTELMGLLVDYQDSFLFNIKNLKLNLSTYFATSYLNYINQSINPIGVIEWQTGKRWNDKLEYLVKIYGNIDYIFQNKIFNSNNFSLSYNYIDKHDNDTTNSVRVPINIINPSIGTYFNFSVLPFFDINLGGGLNYEFNINNLKYNNFSGELKNIYRPNISFGQTFKITQANLTYNITTNLNFDIQDNNYYRENINYIEKNYFYNFLDISIKNRINHSIRFSDKVTQSVELSNTIYQAAYQYNDLYKETESFKDISNTMRITTSLDYTISYDFYKRNNFLTKLKLFYNYNDINTKTDYKNNTNVKTNAQISKILFNTPVNYEIGNTPGEVEGYMGIILNLALNIPLFTFTTPDIFVFNLKKNLEWEANLGFFIDGGLLQEYPDYNPKYSNYILKLGRDKLNLFPALAGGMKFHIVPKFIPAKVIMELGFDLYKIARTGSLSGNYVIILGIENQ